MAASQIICAAAPGPLASYYNKNRVLIIYAPSVGDPRIIQERALLQRGSRSGFADRDLIVIQSLAKGHNTNAAQSRALRALYHIAPDAFQIALIGKDGHVAFTSAAPVAPGVVFERIDRMPMRREEMQRKGEL